jgi:L-threonylcarbamoyladenylate synthase
MPNSHASEFDQVIRSGGVVLFPSDTVYGLACDPDNDAAIKRLYAIKRRRAEKPSARMFFDLGAAVAALPALIRASAESRSDAKLGPRTQAALAELLPGPATLVLPGGLGLRVVDVPALKGARVSVLQSSANLSGGADARTLAEVDESVQAAVDLRIDGGELPGTPSTVIDLRAYEQQRSWAILRQGALPEATVAAILGG